MKKTLVMGIVNVTPDSFSDGGQFFKPAEAVRRAENLIEEGADILDIGGESTRPGSTPIAWDEEWSRIEPVLKELSECPVPISVDTYHPETAARAVGLGATIINCVYKDPIPEMLRIIEAEGKERLEIVVPSQYEGSLEGFKAYLDPMVGFNTTREEDLALLRSIPELTKRGRVLVGASRKRIVKKLTGEKKVRGKDLGGSIGLAVWAALAGASVVRVHDVRETVQALRVAEVLQQV